MDKRGKWQPIEPLGEGGQGQVFIAYDSTRYDPEMNVKMAAQALSAFKGIAIPERQPQALVDLAVALRAADVRRNAEVLGALKVLHKPKGDPGYDKAKARMASEARAYESVNHPSLLRILDRELDEGWLVTEYQAQGTLAERFDLYRGDLLGALVAIRPLVDAVAQIHRAGAVHRDIKPANVFLGRDGRLILGDAGLIFFIDEKHSRVSDTFENVGSRDWMPAWAMGMRVEHIQPTFDVFSLGKLLWSMVAGRPILRLWYQHKPEFELERMFDGDVNIKWARWVLDHAIVENEEDCLRDGGDLLRYIDRAILALGRGAQVVGEGIPRLCTVCALGYYRYISNESTVAAHNYGLGTSGAGGHKIFACVNCGHVQLFYIPNRDADRPEPWPNKPQG